jgi:hypothetical protein
VLAVLGQSCRQQLISRVRPSGVGSTSRHQESVSPRLEVGVGLDERDVLLEAARRIRPSCRRWVPRNQSDVRPFTDRT